MFQGEINPSAPPIRPELEAWLPFDPWRNPAFIDGMTVTFDFEGLGVAKNKSNFSVGRKVEIERIKLYGRRRFHRHSKSI